MRISDWSQTCALPISLFGKLIKTLARGCIPPQLAAAHSPTCCFALQRPIIVPKNKLGSAIWHVGEIGLLAPRSRAPQWTPCWLTHVKSIAGRSEEHTSELQSLMRISYAVFCLIKKTNKQYYKD